MTLSFQQIRQSYPNPRSGIGADPSCSYCVGGAFLKAAESAGYHAMLEYNPDGKTLPTFPEEATLAGALHDVLGLPVATAEIYADEIITCNDDNRFDEAWEALELAMQEAQTLDTSS